MSLPTEPAPARGAFSAPADVFLAFLKLGVTSFGGPVAHLGYFRQEFVVRRRWMEDGAYSDLVALCQVLPGPASSQTGIGIGLHRAGLAGAVAAWLGFTLPSALALMAFGYGVGGLAGWRESGALHGMKVAAVAVVALAVWGMGRALCPDARRASLAVLAALLVLAWPTATGQLCAMVACAAAGASWLPLDAPPREGGDAFGVSRGAAIACWVAFALLLAGLPIAARLSGDHGIALFDSFYRTGALVFGGGHVVLPLLRAEVVPPGWVADDVFLAGYGAAQAVPGPLFTFAAYLGTVMSPAPAGWVGGLLCVTAIFLPGFLLVIGGLPLWWRLRRHARVGAALAGVNAGVVGLLLAALYDPVGTGAIHGRADFGLALAALLLLAYWKISPLIVVLLAAAAGLVLGP